MEEVGLPEVGWWLLLEMTSTNARGNPAGKKKKHDSNINHHIYIYTRLATNKRNKMLGRKKTVADLERENDEQWLERERDFAVAPN